MGPLHDVTGTSREYYSEGCGKERKEKSSGGNSKLAPKGEAR